MNRSWKLVAGICLSIGCGLGLGFVSMWTQKADALTPQKLPVSKKAKVQTPWKDGFKDAKTLAGLLRRSTDTLPDGAVKLVGPLGDSIINAAELGAVLAGFVENNKIDLVMQSLRCVIQENKYLIAAAKKFKKSGKTTSPSGCPEIGCVNKKACLAVNIALSVQMIKELTDVLLGHVKINTVTKKKTFISGLLYNNIELLHNGVEVAMTVDKTLKVMPADARALIDTFVLVPSKAALTVERHLALVVETTLSVLGNVLPLLIGGRDYWKLVGVTPDEFESYLQREIPIDENKRVTFDEDEGRRASVKELN